MKWKIEVSISLDVHEENPLPIFAEFTDVARDYRVTEQLGIHEYGPFYYDAWDFAWLADATAVWEGMIELATLRRYDVRIRFYKYDDAGWHLESMWILPTGLVRNPNAQYYPDIDVDMFPEVEYE